MAIDNTFSPDYAVHPGEYLDELVECVRMEKAELAARLGVTPKHLSAIVNGKAAITAKTAVALEYVFPDRPARYWLGLQEAYDVFEARRASLARVDGSVTEAWLESFDVEALARAGYLPESVSGAGTRERVAALLRFFGCSSIEAWRTLYGGLAARLARSLHDERGSLSLAWMRKGQVEAAASVQSIPRFERRAFGRALRGATALARQPGGKVVCELRRRCADAGVLLRFEKPLPDMMSASAAFWLANTPCIQLSTAVGTSDELWLGFAREAAFVLNGKTYEVSLSDEDWEVEVPQEASSWLVSRERCLAFAERNDFSPEAVRRFAEEEGAHPGIVVGMLQRAGLVSRDSPLNALKTRIDYAVVEF